MALFLVVFQVATANALRETTTQELRKNHQLGIPYDECVSLENKLGQLLYVNVDGFVERSMGPITEPYFQMVKDLQVGGVLPKEGSRDFQVIQKDYQRLKSLTEQPLLMGLDHQLVQRPNAMDTIFGLGSGKGLVGSYGHLPACFNKLAYLEAFLHKSIGLNQALGPTIDNHARGHFLTGEPAAVAGAAKTLIDMFNDAGVETTTKHFPYTPDTFDLHKKSEDTKLSPAEVKKKLEPFHLLAGQTNFVMSTHLFNSKIDSENVATFSEIWIKRLRKEIGFDGILMTDALFMFESYKDSVAKMSSQWPQNQVALRDTQSIYAARSILAGHDMVLLVGTATNTYKTFNNLIKIACQNQPVSRQLAARIRESYDRIIRFKNRKSSHLRQSLEAPIEVVREAGDLHTKLILASDELHGQNATVACSQLDGPFASLKKKIDAIYQKPDIANTAIPNPDLKPSGH